MKFLSNLSFFFLLFLIWGNGQWCVCVCVSSPSSSSFCPSVHHHVSPSLPNDFLPSIIIVFFPHHHTTLYNSQIKVNNNNNTHKHKSLIWFHYPLQILLQIEKCKTFIWIIFEASVMEMDSRFCGPKIPPELRSKIFFLILLWNCYSYGKDA